MPDFVVSTGDYYTQHNQDLMQMKTNTRSERKSEKAIVNVKSFFLFLFLFFFFLLFRAALMAYGSSWARGRIGAAAASLHHRHSDTRSEPQL